MQNKWIMKTNTYTVYLDNIQKYLGYYNSTSRAFETVTFEASAFAFSSRREAETIAFELGIDDFTVMEN